MENVTTSSINITTSQEMVFFVMLNNGESTVREIETLSTELDYPILHSNISNILSNSRKSTIGDLIDVQKKENCVGSGRVPKTFKFNDIVIENNIPSSDVLSLYNNNDGRLYEKFISNYPDTKNLFNVSKLSYSDITESSIDKTNLHEIVLYLIYHRGSLTIDRMRYYADIKFKLKISFRSMAQTVGEMLNNLASKNIMGRGPSTIPGCFKYFLKRDISNENVKLEDLLDLIDIEDHSGSFIEKYPKLKYCFNQDKKETVMPDPVKEAVVDSPNIEELFIRILLLKGNSTISEMVELMNEIEPNIHSTRSKIKTMTDRLRKQPIINLMNCMQKEKSNHDGGGKLPLVWSFKSEVDALEIELHELLPLCYTDTSLIDSFIVSYPALEKYFPKQNSFNIDDDEDETVSDETVNVSSDEIDGELEKDDIDEEDDIDGYNDSIDDELEKDDIDEDSVSEKDHIDPINGDAASIFGKLNDILEKISKIGEDKDINITISIDTINVK